ncbi:hypothetical protein GWK47_006512 [Chionoecetes opilio]|uniref:Core-binding (CB) domain-containing protein n=1 Tax=Chionoecetes opilio TaxID=41210 RepID=A0A8J5CT94_CHIOP|nr:hypothetical protein GWK47_006512 [Chionoecetes opilio]
MDWVLDKVVDQSDCGASVGNTKITDLVFADDAVIFAESLEVLGMALEALHEEAKPLGLEVSWLKTKVQHMEEKGIPIILRFLPGAENVWADALSRFRGSSVEWQLRPERFAALCRRWGTPEVDLFASRRSAQLQAFLTRGDRTAAGGPDALTEDWNRGPRFVGGAPDQASFHLEATRLEFLRTSLRRTVSDAVAEDILAALRPSSTRQYQSHWKAFQSFLKLKGLRDVSESVVLDFLSFLAHDRGRSSATLSTHLAALADPLKYGWGLVLDRRSVTLLKRGLFLQNPPPHRPGPFWSLEKVLRFLQGDQFGSDAAGPRLLQKALFLVALATGFRASQLRALTRFPQWTTFSRDGSAVSLSLSPKVLGKNERQDHRLQPVVVPAWSAGDAGTHPCARFRRSRCYLDASEPWACDLQFLFRDPVTGSSPHHQGDWAGRLRGVIESADPGHAPRAHDVLVLLARLWPSSAPLPWRGTGRGTGEYGLVLRGSLTVPLRRGLPLCCPGTPSVRRGWGGGTPGPPLTSPLDSGSIL